MSTSINKNKSIADEALNLANSMTDITRKGHLYGKLFSLQEMEIHILSEIKKVKEQIEREYK